MRKLTRKRTIEIEHPDYAFAIEVVATIPRAGDALQVRSLLTSLASLKDDDEEADAKVREALATLSIFVAERIESVSSEGEPLPVGETGKAWADLSREQREHAVADFADVLVWPLAFEFSKGAAPRALGKSKVQGSDEKPL